MDFKKNETYRILRGAGKPYKIYILEIIDSEMIVFKWYGRHKQWWHYEIKDKCILEIEVERAKEYKIK